MSLYIRYLKILFKNCLIKNMTYRLQFFTSLLTDACFCFVRLAFVDILFANVDSLLGWNKGNFMIFFGTSFLIESIYMFFFFDGHTNISRKVQSGDMDLLLIRPINETFYMSINSLNFGSGLSNGILGIVYLLMGINRLNISIGFRDLAVYIFLIVIGSGIYFSLSYLINILSFWVVQVSGIFDVFMNITDLYRYPKDIFNKKVGFFITYILPFQMIAIVPAKSLMGEMGKESITSVVLLVVYIIIDKVITKRAINAYVSVGS